MSTGNAFTNPSAAKIDQQRKILEDLERQKKALKSNNSSNIAATTSSSSSALTGTAGGFGPGADGHQQLQLSSNQRMAMDQASKTSFGYFIPQDSLFGNLILPVVPRIPPS